MSRWHLHHGDCLDVLRDVPDDSIDAIVTDPPYGLGFMGAKCDALPPGPEWAAEVLRVAKPGAHLVAFGGQRTIHRLAVALEDAGWEIRDLIGWLQWQGFPKSMDVSKAIDRAAGAEREVVGPGGRSGQRRRAMAGDFAGTWDATAPATDDARRWRGWGTALKPALEPAILARKPLSERTVAANVLRWGTGAINIDACRYADGDPAWPGPGHPVASYPRGPGGNTFQVAAGPDGTRTAPWRPPDAGRFPANVYACPKASRRERGEGNTHPTVKPVRLMRWLCRLVTPPGGTVLDPFLGSGTTGIAALAEGFGFVGVEHEAAYLDIARARIEHHHPPLALRQTA